MKVKCEACPRVGDDVLKAYRLDPRSLRPQYRRLCDRCRRSHGYTVDKTGRGLPHPATNPDVTKGRGNQR